MSAEFGDQRLDDFSQKGEHRVNQRCCWRAKLPVFPVETGISSIFPTQPSFGCKNGSENQVLACEFPW
jgi:hypothetical protein